MDMDRNEQINAGYKKVFGGTLSDSGNMWSAFISGAKWADRHPKSPWISVKKRLPALLKKKKGESEQSSKSVFVIVENVNYKPYCAVAALYKPSYGGTVWTFDGKLNDDEITHWMPIPELPKEE